MRGEIFAITFNGYDDNKSFIALDCRNMWEWVTMITILCNKQNLV